MTIVTLPRAGIPLAGADGRVTPEWYRFFHDITQRVGGVTGSGTDDLTLSQFEDAGIEELKQAVYRNSDDAGQAPAGQVVAVYSDDQSPPIQTPEIPAEWLASEVAELRAQLAEQAKAIQALNQGPTP